MDRLRYLFIAPHSETSQVLADLIEEALPESGAELIALETDFASGSEWIEVIRRNIERADLIIADLTGSNPNIMYEVGYAHALRKQVLPILQLDQAPSSLPDSMRGYLYVVYDPGNPDKFQNHIKSWSSRLLSRAGEPVVHE